MCVSNSLLMFPTNPKDLAYFCSIWPGVFASHWLVSSRRLCLPSWAVRSNCPAVSCERSLLVIIQECMFSVRATRPTIHKPFLSLFVSPARSLISSSNQWGSGFFSTTVPECLEDVRLWSDYQANSGHIVCCSNFSYSFPGQNFQTRMDIWGVIWHFEFVSFHL